MRIEEASKKLGIASSTLYARYGEYIHKGEISHEDIETIRRELEEKRKKRRTPYLKDMVKEVLEHIKKTRHNQMTQESVLEYLREQLKPTGCTPDIGSKIPLERTSLSIGIVNQTQELQAKEFTINKNYFLVKADGAEIALAYEYITFLRFNKSW